MSIDWDEYEPYVPPHLGLPEEMPRSQARTCYEHLMASRAERRRQLERLLAANAVSLKSDDEGLVALGHWFRANVEPSLRDAERLADLWYSVVNDVGLFLGDVTIERAPTLHWAFFVWGRRHVSYHRHVVMGFRGDEKLRLSVDFDQAVAAYGVRAVTGQPCEDDEFLRWVETQVRLA